MHNKITAVTQAHTLPLVVICWICTRKERPMEKPARDETGQATSQHYTYLLRIWRADANHPWRFTLRRVGGEETQYFPSLTAFVTKLWEQLNQGR